MVPTAMYTQERTRTDSGRLAKFMAAPLAPHDWVPVIRALAALPPPRQEVPEPYLQNLPCLGANHFRIHTKPMTMLSPNTPAISIPAPGGTEVSPRSSLRCR